MPDRFTNDGTHDHSPVCAEGHECNAVKACDAGIQGCDGKVFCYEHLTRCEGCELAFCPADACRFLEGSLCEDCVALILDGIARRHAERVEGLQRLAGQVRRRA